MKKFIILSSMVLFFGAHSNAQQNLFGRAQIVSPDIHPDNSVTLKVSAADAKQITVSGEWLPVQGFMPKPASLVKGDSGIWVYTTPVLSSNLYTYSFTVDGVRTIDQNNAYVVRDVANISSFFIVGGGKGDLYKVNEVPHGSVTRRWYSSPGNSMTRRITIYTPPGYETNKEKYPVLYLMHGIGGDEEAWMGLGRASQIMDNMIAQKKVVPMIVVMTNGNVAQEAAPGEGSAGQVVPTFMLPHTMDGKFEETFIDIIHFVESDYRVKADKEDRAIAGLSMGGYHANYISRFYPNTFDYIGLFSPALNAKPDTLATAYRNLDASLKTQIKNGYKLYWIAVGKYDFPILYKGIQDYKQKMDMLGMKYEYVESDGGHTWTNWRDYLVAFSQRLFK